MTMYVNGQRIKQVSLPPTANWDTWTNRTESVNLSAGKNTIEFIREEGDTGRFNIDSLTIDKSSGGFMSSTAKKIIPEKMVKIQPKHSGKALDVDRVSSNPLAVINQWANGDGNNQLWRFLDLGTGYYQIQSVQSGHVLDILPGSAIQQLCQNTKASGSIPDTQQWKLENSGDYYKIVNKSNNKVITVEGASKSDGAAVRLADDHTKDNQRMKIEIRNLSNSEISALTGLQASDTAVSEADPELSPEGATYDLRAPGDVSTGITWNIASSVTGVVYNENPVTPDGYFITGDVLTLRSDYLTALGLESGNQTEFIISFDKGNPFKFTVNIVDSSAPVTQHPSPLTAKATFEDNPAEN